jgi:hypothetical protein
MISRYSQLQESMGWTPCSVGEAVAMLAEGTHELTIVREAAVAFAAPKGEGETVDPNEVFLDALEANILLTPWAGGTHARDMSELTVKGLAAAFVTRSRRATRAVQTSIMDGDLPPLGEPAGPTLGERFAARNTVVTAPAEPEDGYPVISWVAEASAANQASAPPTPVRTALSGPAAPQPLAAPRLADARPAPQESPNRPVNPCGECIFAGGVQELSQGNASVTVLDGRAVVRFSEEDGDELRITGAATVALPASSRNWSYQEVSGYAIGKVLDGTRTCSDSESGNARILRGWLGILGVDVGCSGLVRANSKRNRLIPNADFTEIGDPQQ